MKNTGLSLKNTCTHHCLAVILRLAIFFAGTCFLATSAFADDDNVTMPIAKFSSSTLLLEVPELGVEGTDLLYSAKFQMKQQGQDIFLELVSLEATNPTGASVTRAIISTGGMLHIPALNIDDQSVWIVDLTLVSDASPLPIRFNISSYSQLPEGSSDEELLGVWRGGCKWIYQGKLGFVRYCCDENWDCEIVDWRPLFLF